MKRLLLVAAATFLIAPQACAGGIGYPREGNPWEGKKILRMFKEKVERADKLLMQNDRNRGCRVAQEADDLATKYWWDIVAFYKDVGATPKEWVQTHRSMLGPGSTCYDRLR